MWAKCLLARFLRKVHWPHTICNCTNKLAIFPANARISSNTNSISLLLLFFCCLSPYIFGGVVNILFRGIYEFVFYRIARRLSGWCFEALCCYIRTVWVGTHDRLFDTLILDCGNRWFVVVYIFFIHAIEINATLAWRIYHTNTMPIFCSCFYYFDNHSIIEPMKNQILLGTYAAKPPNKKNNNNTDSQSLSIKTSELSEKRQWPLKLNDTINTMKAMRSNFGRRDQIVNKW